jgi:hypothetical protein
MGEPETAFKVRDIEVGDHGLFLAFPPSSQLMPGMAVENQTLRQKARGFLVVDVVRPSDRDPAALLPRAAPEDFRIGDQVIAYANKTQHGTLLLQSCDTWFLRGRGVVVSGTAQGIITKGDELLLLTEDDATFDCRCQAIERFDDGSGRPTRRDERGVSILLSIDGEEASAAIDAEDSERLLQLVGQFPSLHRKDKPDTDHDP